MKKGKYVKSKGDSSDDEIDELEALITKIFWRGRGKYKGKLPIHFFSCNKVGHIAVHCLDKEDKDERKERKYKGRRDDQDYKKNKEYKEKGKKYCYSVEEKTDNESKINDDEIFYVAMKEDYDEDYKTTLISYVNKSDRWIIDSGCSNYMTSD